MRTNFCSRQPIYHFKNPSVSPGVIKSYFSCRPSIFFSQTAPLQRKVSALPSSQSLYFFCHCVKNKPEASEEEKLKHLIKEAISKNAPVSEIEKIMIIYIANGQKIPREIIDDTLLYIERKMKLCTLACLAYKTHSDIASLEKMMLDLKNLQVSLQLYLVS